ncbi:hypothetical protein [Laspinema palackyanum]
MSVVTCHEGMIFHSCDRNPTRFGEHKDPIWINLKSPFFLFSPFQQ